MPFALTHLHIDLSIHEPFSSTALPVPSSMMKGLNQFWSLKSLTLKGMTHSYQDVIWKTAWKNDSLTHLELRMATMPTARFAAYGAEVQSIGEDWEVGKNAHIPTVYQ